MNKMFRFSVIALAIVASVVSMVPTAQAQIGDCPVVEVSYDGGETWEECDNYGRYETRDSVTCYYSC